MRAGGQTDRQTDRQTDVTKLIVAFHNFANAPNKNVTQDFYRAQNTFNSEFIFSLCSVCFDKYVTIVRPSRYKTFAVSRPVLSFCSRVRIIAGSLLEL